MQLISNDAEMLRAILRGGWLGGGGGVWGGGGGGGGGGGVLPCKSLMGTCGQPGYCFRVCCLKQGIRVSFLGR